MDGVEITKRSRPFDFALPRAVFAAEKSGSHLLFFAGMQQCTPMLMVTFKVRPFSMMISLFRTTSHKRFAKTSAP